jgi:hypothetical protein
MARAKPPGVITDVITDVLSLFLSLFSGGSPATGHRGYHRGLAGFSAGFSRQELSAIFFANIADVRVIPGPGHAGTVSEASAPAPTPLQGL